MAFNFVHAADIHLGTSFEGIARPAPDVAALLREAPLKAWGSLVDCCLEQSAAFLLLAGDVFDADAVDVRTQLRFLAGLRRLSAAGVSTFIVHGNHDPLSARGRGTAIRQWPSGVTVFGSHRVETASVEAEGEVLAEIHGISYPRRDTRENLARRYGRGSHPCLQVGLLHSNVGSNTDHDDYAPATIGDLESAGLDYWALGHVHKGQILKRGGPWIVYPGALQGRSPKPAEQGAKGAMLVSAEGTEVLGVQFVPLDNARFASAEISIVGLDDLGALEEHVSQSLDDLRSGHENRPLIVRLRLTGRGPLASTLHTSQAADSLLLHLREINEGLEPLVWVESLKDETRSVMDEAILRQRDDFLGELLRCKDDLVADPSQLATVLEQATTLLGVGRVGRQVGELSDENPARIIDEAFELAFDSLDVEADE